MCTGLLLYSIVGLTSMYPGFEKMRWEYLDSVVSGVLPMVNGSLDLDYNAGYTICRHRTRECLQLAATIVSGAVCDA
jgi:hypothetical protein